MATMKVTGPRRFAVWGAGASNSEIVRSGEPSAKAEAIAADRGFQRGETRTSVGLASEAWCVEVECDKVALDAQTRYDAATIGWCAI